MKRTRFKRLVGHATSCDITQCDVVIGLSCPSVERKYNESRRFWSGFSCPRDCNGLGRRYLCRIHKVKRLMQNWMSALPHLPSLQIDSSLTSRYPASSKLETEPQSHHQLPIPQRIANAGRQGFQWGTACFTSTKDVVG